jgi:hypothetical protein
VVNSRQGVTGGGCAAHESDQCDRRYSVSADIKQFPVYPLNEKTVFRFQVHLLSGLMTENFLKQHKKMPMRTIDIRGSQTLEDLHNAIFKAFDRFDQHLFEFQIGGKKPMDKKSIRYGILGFDDDMEENIEDATTATIASLILMPGNFFFYWFDFGDDWWHKVIFDTINPESKGKGRYPRIVERIGESPPQYVDWDAESDEHDMSE